MIDDGFFFNKLILHFDIMVSFVSTYYNPNYNIFI